MVKAREYIKSLLEYADIKVDGNRSWDIQIHNEDFYKRVLSDGPLGLGESYMDGWWDSEKLDEFFYKILISKLDKKIKPDLGTIILNLESKFLNMQTRIKSKKVATQHYNLNAELYESFLDPYNQYTCGYFKDTEDLNKAQELKLGLICRKLQLDSEDKVLDIGSGWGGFAKFATQNYGCHVTGINISDEQIKYSKEYTKGLPVEIRKQDYRDLDGEFDKVLICGMIEHVGYKNYKDIMKIVHNHLKDNGLFLLHTIGRNESITYTEPWINKYIFPNSMLPSIKQISESIENLFVVEDWHNFSAHYDKTLMAWRSNFNRNWNRIKSKYDKRFFRMWNYYLLSSAGSFRARKNQLWQVVMSKNGVPNGYESIR
ncbi:MAG: cyclopropane fatty acyl phospholipid synthase [Nanoarchaeota archaeon]